MKSWEKFIFESKRTPSETRKKGEEVLKDIQNKAKSDDKKSKKSDYTKYLEKQLEYKRQKYEDQKKRQLEKIKEKQGTAHIQKAKEALKNIKTQTIGHKDSDVTGYEKAIGNVASAAGGLTKAAYHGVRYLAAKRKAKKELELAKEKQKEKKEPGKPGRRPKSDNAETTAQKQQKKPQQQITGSPEPKRLIPSTKRLTPSSKKLPPSGGVPEKRRELGMSLGQRARRNPELKAQLIKKNMGEEYSNWREEFIFEVEDKNTKKEKKKIIDVMPDGKKNTIEINPKITEQVERDDEGGMVHNELSTMERAIKSLRKKIKSPGQQLPGWVQSKITKAVDAIDTVADYMESGEKIKEESDLSERYRTSAWQRREGQNAKGGLNEKGRKAYEEENPGSDLKRPQPEGGSRRDSYCARSAGQMKMWPKAAKDPNSRLRLARKKWNC
jgi:hypothetical protein